MSNYETYYFIEYGDPIQRHPQPFKDLLVAIDTLKTNKLNGRVVRQLRVTTVKEEIIWPEMIEKY